ncbi:MAG: 6-bladed beta-propeller [Marinifilaceae bacterium]|nr:6-bladed beta-propeller [Marinifilaceae bacterium]
MMWSFLNNKIKLAFIITSIILYYGCNRMQSENIKPTENCIEIDIPLENKDNVTMLSEAIDSVQIITLETNDSCIIGSYNKIIADGQKLFIMDAISNTVFTFDYSGKFLFSIGTRGRGPFEFLEMCDFCILSNKNILVSDERIRKLSLFDSIGNPIREIYLNHNNDPRSICNNRICNINDSIIAMYGCTGYNNVTVFDINSEKILFQGLPYHEGYSEEYRHAFNKMGTQVQLLRSGATEIYNINADKIELARHLDFGQHQNTGEYESAYIPGVGTITAIKANQASVSYYYENFTNIILSFNCEVLNNGYAYIFVYNKSTKNHKFLSFNSECKDDCTFYRYLPHFMGFDNCNNLIATLPVYDWQSNMNNLKNHNKYKEISDRIKNINPDNNNCILLYHVKEF